MRLIDADKMRENLLWCKEQSGSYNDVYWDDVIERLDVQPTVGGWISVKDRLPEDGRDVLAYYNNPEESRIVPVNYYNDVWFDCVFNRPIDIDIDYITHWMPLPEPPKED